MILKTINRSETANNKKNDKINPKRGEQISIREVEKQMRISFDKATITFYSIVSIHVSGIYHIIASSRNSSMIKRKPMQDYWFLKPLPDILKANRPIHA